MCRIRIANPSFPDWVVSNAGVSQSLLESIRLMRRYCARFLQRVGASEDVGDDEAGRRHLFREPRWRMPDYWFGEALGELRSGIGLQVALIAASYGLDVEDDLAQILPEPESS